MSNRRSADATARSGSIRQLRDRSTAAPCRFCGAPVGQPCTTTSGRVAIYPHRGRMGPANAAARRTDYEPKERTNP